MKKRLTLRLGGPKNTATGCHNNAHHDNTKNRRPLANSTCVYRLLTQRLFGLYFINLTSANTNKEHPAPEETLLPYCPAAWQWLRVHLRTGNYR